MHCDNLILHIPLGVVGEQKKIYDTCMEDSYVCIGMNAVFPFVLKNIFAKFTTTWYIKMFRIYTSGP